MYDALAEWLPRAGADVVCLQEVARTPGLGGWTHFEDGERALPQRANFFDDVRAALPRHQGAFLASDAGPVLDADGDRHQQDFGLATFVGEQLPVIGRRSPSSAPSGWSTWSARRTPGPPAMPSPSATPVTCSSRILGP